MPYIIILLWKVLPWQLVMLRVRVPILYLLSELSLLRTYWFLNGNRIRYGAENNRFKSLYLSI